MTVRKKARVRGGWWLFFVAFVLAGCTERPLVCEPQAIFRPVPAIPKKGELPPDVHELELGPKLELAQVEIYPTSLIFFEDNRVRVWWRALGHIAARTQALYSSAERVVRSVEDPDEVFSLRRFSDGSSERVWLTFDTPTCRAPAPPPGRQHCAYGSEEWLVVDMTCRRERVQERRRKPRAGRGYSAVPSRARRAWRGAPSAQPSR